MATLKIHPGIGIARVGDSEEGFYLAPETTGGLPIECDPGGNAVIDGSTGNEKTTDVMRDAAGCVKRQAARFRIFVYDQTSPSGRELKLGDEIQGVGSKGKLTDIHWFAYPANKKSSWYEFEQLEGEHGYAPDHPRRNAGVTGQARNSLNIDPGGQFVNTKSKPRASFARGKNPGQSQTFPPPLRPFSIETLGEMMTDDAGRLIFLGGHGNSGSYLSGFADPKISHYANNDGWFDDVSDGPVTAILEYWDELDEESRYLQVDEPAWVIVGYPRYAPQLVDMITGDDLLFDLSVREFAYDTYLYGRGNFTSPEQVDITDPDALADWRAARKWWNPDYYPYFYRDIWPLLLRPYNMQYLTDVLAISNLAHEIGPDGDFEEDDMATPPLPGEPPELAAKRRAKREFVFNAIRRPGDDNKFQTSAPVTRHPKERVPVRELMPLLAGDNPISNTLPAKFLTLTMTQYFMLSQWAKGKFINERLEDIGDAAVGRSAGKGTAIDRGVLGNVLGGAFCPGGEISWNLRNPALYSGPYRIKHDPAYVPTEGSTRGFNPDTWLPDQGLSMDDDFCAGQGPGDLTKHSAVPWQSDFNECSTQTIDITYQQWNKLYTQPCDCGEDHRTTNETLWWPSHRPMQVYRFKGAPADPGSGRSYWQGDWALGIPATEEGDLKMVTAWRELGFVIANPYGDEASAVAPYISVDT